MEPIGPLDQLAMCCGLNLRGQKAGFDRAFHQHRNYYYSPSIAHMNAFAGNGPHLAATTATPINWPMAGPIPFLQPPPQPYFLVTQPVIIANPQQQQQQQPANTSEQADSLRKRDSQLLTGPDQRGQQQQIAQQQLVSVGRPVSLRAPIPSQYAICYQTTQQQQQPTQAAGIYDNPRQLDQRQLQLQLQQDFKDNLRSNYQNETLIGKQYGPRRPPRALNAEIFKRLEIIEKQVDLTQEMELVERHSIVITRAIDPYTLMPHLTSDTLRQYQTHLLLSDEYVIRFIEIIKRPGQTLGLYIRTVQFENPVTGIAREGLVVTKIESDSPIYTSQVLHVGDEILSINLIDVHGMSLDDVVIIMSIPKRLVLALRIPRDRDQLLMQDQSVAQDHILDRKPTQMHSSQSLAGLGLSPRRQNSGLVTALQPNDFHLRSVEVPIKPSPSLSQPPSRQKGDQNRSSIVRADGNFSTNNIMIEKLDEQNEDQPGIDITIDQLELSQMKPSQIPDQQHQRQQQHRSTIGQFDRQMAISQSIELVNHDQIQAPNSDRPKDSSRDSQGFQTAQSGSEGFQSQNLSFDQELANLEREAMNRERPKLPLFTQVEGFSDYRDQSRSYAGSHLSNNQSSTPHHQRYESTSPKSGSRNNVAQRLIGDTASNMMSPRTTNTLPRRILPTLPDEDLESSSSPASQQAGSSSNPTTLRRPLIDNIRLGSTNEQSSYFSSSIEAINRELKELRRQRIALDIEDQTSAANNNSGLS